MEQLAQQAAETIKGYRANKIIMDFVTNEAMAQTAADIRAKTGSGTTAKAVQLLMIKNQQVAKRVEDYITTGLIACYMEAIGA